MPGNRFLVRVNSDPKCEFCLRLGQQQEAEILSFRADNNAREAFRHITVEPGFRSSLTLNETTHLTPESLTALITNLADNNGYDTLTLTLGDINLSKLDADTIALAQAKNYTLI